MTLGHPVQLARALHVSSMAIALLGLSGEHAAAQGGPWIFPEPVYTSGSEWSSGISVRVGDVNGDGRPDVVATNAHLNTVNVFAGNAAGTLDTAVPYSSGGSGPVSVAIGDLNGDGRPDVVVANRNGTTISVLAGNAGGTLDAAVSYPSGGYSPTSIAIG